tara:strand:- start:6231 stop:6476 length:246 start_codon:yes stop_codon:yes gene_type:complete
MKKYLTLLLTEKGITNDITNDMIIDGHYGLTYEMQIDFICSADKDTIATIRKTFVKIDFLNGNVAHYWEHITKGMLASLGY